VHENRPGYSTSRFLAVVLRDGASSKLAVFEQHRNRLLGGGRKKNPVDGKLSPVDVWTHAYLRLSHRSYLSTTARCKSWLIRTTAERRVSVSTSCTWKANQEVTVAYWDVLPVCGIVSCLSRMRGRALCKELLAGSSIQRQVPLGHLVAT